MLKILQIKNNPVKTNKLWEVKNCFGSTWQPFLQLLQLVFKPVDMSGCQ